MTKVDLAEIIALQHGISKVQATRIVQTFICIVRETMAAGGTLYLSGLGTFRAVRAGARVGLNPRTGERVTIEAIQRPRFIAGRALRHAVRAGSGLSGHGQTAYRPFSSHAHPRKV
jgi:DNA-binding protein HU-beta